MKMIGFALFCVTLSLAACNKESEKKPAESAAPPAAAPASGAPAATAPAGEDTDHAGAGVVPGSHEDWCGEHGVPESQCTRCNPDLIAAFKATGDWCEEHGLPMSQCLKHNPDLKIVRPAKTP